MTSIPTAKVKTSKTRLSLSWLVPLFALLITLVLFFNWWMNQGVAIRLAFQDAGGLTVNSPIMYRGAIVGRIENIALSSDSDSVQIHARLSPSATDLAREGSQWWVVQPSVSLQGVQGLDTIVGPRYIEVMPGNGDPVFSFVGLQNGTPQQGKPFTLVTSSADNLTIGAPVYYRGVEVGLITNLEIADDSTTVRVGCSVQHRYAPLVRTNSKFWNISGIRVDADFLGIDFQAGPVTSWIKGGIAFATPTQFGDIAPEGFAFSIAEERNDDWLEWAPHIELEKEANAK